MSEFPLEQPVTFPGPLITNGINFSEQPFRIRSKVDSLQSQNMVKVWHIQSSDT